MESFSFFPLSKYYLMTLGGNINKRTSKLYNMEDGKDVPSCLRNLAQLPIEVYAAAGAALPVGQEATIVGTAQSAEDPHGGHHTRLVDGKGIDGVWVYDPNPTVCASAPGTAGSTRWFSLELEVPLVVTKVQLAKRLDTGVQGQAQYVTITIGSKMEYDPSDDLCRPEINELEHISGLVDYPCTANPQEGKFVKISKGDPSDNTLTICEAKVFGFPAGKQTSKLTSYEYVMK